MEGSRRQVPHRSFPKFSWMCARANGMIAPKNMARHDIDDGTDSKFFPLLLLRVERLESQSTILPLIVAIVYKSNSRNHLY